MTVAPLIAMKSTAVRSFEAVGKELDRRAHTYDQSDFSHLMTVGRDTSSALAMSEWFASGCSRA